MYNLRTSSPFFWSAAAICAASSPVVGSLVLRTLLDFPMAVAAEAMTPRHCRERNNRSLFGERARTESYKCTIAYISLVRVQRARDDLRLAQIVMRVCD